MFRKLSVAVVLLCFFGQAAPAAAQANLFWASPALVDIDESGGTVVLELAVIGTSAVPIMAQIRINAGSSAIGGDDFTGGTTAANWLAGDSNSIFLEIDIIDDVLVEGPEFVLVEIYSATGAEIILNQNMVRININDNDSPVTLPRVSLHGGLNTTTQMQDLYCYDALGQIYPCGQSLTALYQAIVTKSFQLQISPVPAPGEIVSVVLESWGGVTLMANTVNLDETGSVFVDFLVPENVPVPFGGVRILPSGGYAEPTAGDFHEMNITINAMHNWQPFHCSGCYIVAHVGGGQSDCGGFPCSGTTNCGPTDKQGISGGNKSATSDLDMLRRYRDELLSGTSNGQATEDLYDAMGGGVVSAFFADPSLGGDYVNARNSWMPALVDLLDGSGTMIITAGMQSDLTAFFDKIADVATGDLVSQLSGLRNSAGLDALTGLTISAAHTNFTGGGATPVESSTWGNLKAQYR